MVQGVINKTDVLKLRDKLYEGMYVTTPKGKAKLIEKYPYIAITDKGCWNWTDIYLAEHGITDGKEEVKHE